MKWTTGQQCQCLISLQMKGKWNESHRCSTIHNNKSHVHTHAQESSKNYAAEQALYEVLERGTRFRSDPILSHRILPDPNSIQPHPKRNSHSQMAVALVLAGPMFSFRPFSSIVSQLWKQPICKKNCCSLPQMRECRHVRWNGLTGVSKKRIFSHHTLLLDFQVMNQPWPCLQKRWWNHTWKLN